MTVKLHIVSDLHLEFGTNWLPTADADVLVVAGDLQPGGGIEWLEFVSDHFDLVLFIPGNHEYYGKNIWKVRGNFDNYRHDKVKILDNKGFIYKGITFLGTTLWTWANAEQARVLKNHMNDYWVIKNMTRRLTPDDTNKYHDEAVRFLGDNIVDNTVVITHHAPTLQSLHPKYLGDPLNCGFVNDLEDFILKHQPKLWIHGHTHTTFDYKVGDTRVICNPRGYVRGVHSEGTGFNPNLVVEV